MILTRLSNQGDQSEYGNPRGGSVCRDILIYVRREGVKTNLIEQKNSCYMALWIQNRTDGCIHHKRDTSKSDNVYCVL